MDVSGSMEAAGNSEHIPRFLDKNWRNDDNVGISDCLRIMIAYSIFSLYRNTKIIHSIMMIWRNNFIESNYNLASGPPKDPGGVKNIFSYQRGHWFIEFSPKNQAIIPVSKRVGFVFSFFVLYLPQEIVYFLAKKRKNWDDEYDMMGYNLGKYTGNNSA